MDETNFTHNIRTSNAAAEDSKKRASTRQKAQSVVYGSRSPYAPGSHHVPQKNLYILTK
jgi:hypothetical protein